MSFRPDVFTVLLFAYLALSEAVHAAADIQVLEPRRLHLGRPGQWEWDGFKDLPVDGENLETRFEAQPNAIEQTLHLWQRGVREGWPVLLNGRKIRMLTRDESAMETVLAIPAGALQAGENVLAIPPPNQLDDIDLGPISIEPRPVAKAISGAAVSVIVTDRKGGATIPCRLTLTRPDGTLQPMTAGPSADVAVRTGVVYTKSGKATLTLPRGDYVLHAGSGFEWGVGQQTFSLKQGDSKEIAISLQREVDTTGFIAADSHIHTLTYSGHGDATIQERMLTIAGEGIELAIATDHNHHTDYAPVAAEMGVSDRFTSVIGNEVTTRHGHFNAFPVPPDAKPVDHVQDEWPVLIPAMRAIPGVKVITLNHPRGLHSGFIPLGGIQFNAATGKHRHAEGLHVDAIKVITSGALQSDIHLLYRHWFALLNRGHRISAIGSSDTHDLTRFILGQGRTYVAVNDADSARLDLEEVWRSYQKGRLLVSLGLLADLRVNDRYSVGDMASDLGEHIKVEATVSGPAWAAADRMELFANGLLICKQTLPKEDQNRAGIKSRVIWDLPRPAHDTHLVVIATGPGVTTSYWEIPRPYQPASKAFNPRVIGSTNPVWLDTDGDGQFHSAYAIAQALVHRAGGDMVRLRKSLKDCDAAVTIQAQSLAPALIHP